MLTILRGLLGGVSGLFGNIFGFLGGAVEFIARTPMALLETFGFVQHAPKQMTAEEAEEATAQAQQAQHFGSALDKKGVVWTPEQKLAQIGRWCYWKTGIDTGLEPSLAGLTTREKLKLRAADNMTLRALTLRTLPQVEAWFQSPKRALTPLTQAEFTNVQRQLGNQNRDSEKAFARWDVIGRDLKAGQEARAASTVAETDDVIRLAEEALSYGPRPSFA